jgi:hypothetical protein
VKEAARGQGSPGMGRGCLGRALAGGGGAAGRQLSLHRTICCRLNVTPTVSVLAVMKARLAGATKGATHILLRMSAFIICTAAGVAAAAGADACCAACWLPLPGLCVPGSAATAEPKPCPACLAPASCVLPPVPCPARPAPRAAHVCLLCLACSALPSLPCLARSACPALPCRPLAAEEEG